VETHSYKGNKKHASDLMVLPIGIKVFYNELLQPENWMTKAEQM